MNTASRPPELARDQADSAFTAILRHLWRSEPDVLAIAFVDKDGECIDYCSALDVFDAKLAGAQMRIVTDQVQRATRWAKGGNAYSFFVSGSERDLVVRRVDDENALVVVVRGGMTDATVLDAISTAVGRIRLEAVLPIPGWDPRGPLLRVRTRPAVGWDFAPCDMHDGERSHEIVAVLGRWEEDPGVAGGALTCFRVRTTFDDELTIAYDRDRDAWMWW